MPTTNPVPSTDPTDLLFNAGKLDEVVNGTANSFTDRLGIARRTVAGMNADFDAQLADAESDLNVYRADAAASAAEALGYLQTIRATSYGAYAEDPTTDPLGNPPTVGDEYFNTTANLLKRWNGTTWQASDINTANLAASSGSSLVGYDDGTAQDVLDGAKSLQDYAKLRAYTGRAKRVYITGLPGTKKPAGISGPFQYDSSDTTSADNGGTVIVGADGRRWKRDFSGPAMAAWFGADPLGVNDSSAPIIAALAAHSHVVVGSGSHRCDTMIEVNGAKTLELLSGTLLRRYAANSSSTDPVVWLKQPAAGLIGAGQASSTVYSENRCPKGVVRIGHKDMTESHATVSYCKVGDLTISGHLLYGQTTGDPDVALYIPNPQLGGLANYFHNIFGIRVQRANIGIWLQGWANGNTISNIQGYQIGNTALGVDKNAFIFCNGALDNSVSNVFFHSSPNSIGLLIDNYDNTANGGYGHNVYANSFGGMVFEQGGASALGLKSLVTTGDSYYEIRHNTSAGISVPDGFYDNNVVVGLTYIACKSLNPATVSARGDITSSTTVKGASVESTGDSRVFGALRQGDGSTVFSAKKVKRSLATNAATTKHTLSCTSPGGALHRSGYLYIKCSGIQTDVTGLSTAWFLYACRSVATAYPVVFSLADSGGNTAAFTVSFLDGVVTVATVMDDLTTSVEFGFSTGNVNVT